MSKKTSLKIPYNEINLKNKVDELYEKAVEECVEENNTEEVYESYINDIYGNILVCNTTYTAAEILKETSPFDYEYGRTEHGCRIRESAEDEIIKDDFMDEALTVLNMETRK